MNRDIILDKLYSGLGIIGTLFGFGLLFVLIIIFHPSINLYFFSFSGILINILVILGILLLVDVILVGLIHIKYK